MPPPIPRCSSWAYSSLISPSHFSLPRYGSRVGLHIDLFEACSAFTRVAACTLALPPIRDTLIEGFSHFVTSMTAPIASGWSVAGWDLHPLESAAFARRTPMACHFVIVGLLGFGMGFLGPGRCATRLEPGCSGDASARTRRHLYEKHPGSFLLVMTTKYLGESTPLQLSPVTGRPLHVARKTCTRRCRAPTSNAMTRIFTRNGL
jgi:hypothetical protein